jgi:hypothetical protein
MQTADEPRSPMFISSERAPSGIVSDTGFRSRRADPSTGSGWSVIVFQPKLPGERAGVSLTRSRAAVPAGKYAVEIGNLVTAKGAPTHFGYVVDLIDFPEAPPAEVRTGGEPPTHAGPPAGPVIHTTTKAAN